VHVTLDECHIRGSPFKAIVGEADPDPGAILARGEGLVGGKTGKPLLHSGYMHSYV